jgi:hypothetical protein
VERFSRKQGAAVGLEIVDTLQKGDAHRVGAEVRFVDPDRGTISPGRWILEVAHQFSFLAVDADSGMGSAQKTSALLADVVKLPIPIGAAVGGDLLVVDTQEVIHLVQKAPNGRGADFNADPLQLGGNLGVVLRVHFSTVIGSSAVSYSIRAWILAMNWGVFFHGLTPVPMRRTARVLRPGSATAVAPLRWCAGRERATRPVSGPHRDPISATPAGA